MTDERDRTPFDDVFDLIEALREAAESGDASRSGHVGDGDTRIDFSYSVNTGLGPGAPGRRGHPSLGGDRETVAVDPDDRPDDYPTSVARGDDGSERVVAADLSGSGATPEGVETSVAGDELVVSADGAVLCRIGLDGDGPWTVVEHSLRNGVFEARVIEA